MKALTHLENGHFMGLISFFLIFNCFSIEKLPLLETKQAIQTIRFISEDGKYTYSQRRSGALLMSYNYKSHKILEFPTGVEYFIASFPKGDRLAIEVSSAHHQNFDPNKLNTIYTTRKGSKIVSEVGKGVDVKVHLPNNFISYYHPLNKTISVHNVLASEEVHQITLSRKHNPFFRPDVIMPNPETVLYTDINDKGHAALLLYNLLTKKIKVLYKSSLVGMKFETCLTSEMVFVGEFSYPGVFNGSKIMQIKTNSGSFAGLKTIYQSSSNDIGNLNCLKDEAYFIKSVSEDKNLNLKITEVAMIDNDMKKPALLTNLKSVSQIINMDGRLLIPFREKVFVLKGAHQIADDKIEKEEK